MIGWGDLPKKYPAILSGVGQRGSLLNFSPPQGWLPLIDRLCAEVQGLIDRGEAQQIEAEQVKQKYRELRFYYYPHQEQVDEIVSRYEMESRTVCEGCGVKVSEGRQGPGWGCTLCVQCDNR